MAAPAQRGQVIVELVLYALLLVGLFLIAFTLSETMMKGEAKNRFQNSRTGGLPARGFK